MLNPEHERRRAHLARLFKASKMKQADFARKIGVTPSYLSQMLSSGFRFGEKAARGFEEKLHRPLGEFESPNELGLSTIDIWNIPSDLPENVFALVPRINIQLAAGTGGINQSEEEMPPLAFRADWLRGQNVTNKGNLRTCEVKGDSMEPFLQNGDTVLIDIGQSEIINDKVFAIRYGDDLRIKRLSKRFDGGLLIRSDNPRYPEEALSATEAEQITIVGRQLWRGGSGIS
jgi:phage repressor protein C with HTH and peptisase S24 domain